MHIAHAHASTQSTSLCFFCKVIFNCDYCFVFVLLFFSAFPVLEFKQFYCYFSVVVLRPTFIVNGYFGQSSVKHRKHQLKSNIFVSKKHKQLCSLSLFMFLHGYFCSDSSDKIFSWKIPSTTARMVDHIVITYFNCSILFLPAMIYMHLKIILLVIFVKSPTVFSLKNMNVEKFLMLFYKKHSNFQVEYISME